MATGRKTVVVGQVIDPDLWGNPLWDQSVQTFASAADRTAQFPNPKLGALTYLEDVKQLQIYHGATTFPQGWHPVDYRTHAELSGTATANNGAPTAVSGWVLAAAPSWGNVVTISGANLVVVSGGLHALHCPVQFGAVIAGRAYGEILVNGASVGARSLGGGGDDRFSVAVPNLLLNTGDQLQLIGWQGSGSAQSLFGTMRITRLGAGKPTAASRPAPDVDLPDEVDAR